MDAIESRVEAIRFQDDTLEAARASLEILQTHLPRTAALISFFDAARHEFIVVDATSEGGVLERYTAADPLCRVVASLGRVFSWNDLPGQVPARFAGAGEVTRLLAAPILVEERMLGAIEIVRGLEGPPFGSFDEKALDCVASHLATFVASHGVVTDVGKVARFSASRSSRNAGA